MEAVAHSKKTVLGGKELTGFSMELVMQNFFVKKVAKAVDKRLERCYIFG